jgi:hypothetical protein
LFFWQQLEGLLEIVIEPYLNKTQKLIATCKHTVV